MIEKALIPIAGLGRRMGPLAQVVPKAMFPLPADGLLPGPRRRAGDRRGLSGGLYRGLEGHG